MKDNKFLSIFLKDVYTKEEALRKFDILEDFLLKKFFEKEEKPLPSALKNLPKEFLGKFNIENVVSLLRDLEDSIEKKEPLILYLPFLFPEEELKKIGDFVKKKIDESTILEFREDKSLIGGCALVWHGKYKDFSLKKLIKEKRKEIFEIFSQYLK